MLDLNTTLETIRAFAPNLKTILERLDGPLEPERLSPVLCDYLDATCPGWRECARWMTVHCASCDAPLSRPTRRTTKMLAHPGDQRGELAPAVQSGRFLCVAEAPPNILIRWNSDPPELQGVILNPEDARGLECDDTGCCGYAGTPGNSSCASCGATVATMHLDCCGWHYVHTKPGWTRLVWGIPELDEDDQATLDWLKKLPHTPNAKDSPALAALRGLAGPLSPELETAANELLGPIGARAAEQMGAGRVERGWRAGFGYDVGRWEIREADGALLEVTFYRTEDYERRACGPRLRRSWDGHWTLEWLSGLSYSDVEQTWRLSGEERDALVRWLDAPRRWGDLKWVRGELSVWLAVMGREGFAQDVPDEEDEDED